MTSHLSERAGEEGLGGIREVRPEPWHDIATAPKDGTHILLTAFGGQIGVGVWRDGWVYHGLPATPVDWWDEPSHWTPLPPPPGSSQANLADAPKDPSLSEAREEIERLRGALEPLARLEIPRKPVGNAGAYSIRHDHIRAAISALNDSKPMAGKMASADWLGKARELYDRCKCWPEKTPDGVMALIELRNHVYAVLSDNPTLENGKANLADANSNDTRLLRERVRELEQCVSAGLGAVSASYQQAIAEQQDLDSVAARHDRTVREWRDSARSVLAQGGGA